MVQVKIEEKKLKDLIRQTVIETLQTILRDPDFGLELQDWVKKRLRRYPKKLIPFEEIKKKYL
jgi:predicted nucleic-acid-binding protein